MNVTQLYNQLNRFIDESDETYVTSSDREQWLEMAYNEFRSHVIMTAPEIYMKDATITLDNSLVYDFANPPVGGLTLLGPNATERLYRIYRVSIPNDDGTVNRYLPAFSDPKVFTNVKFAFGTGWTITGSKLVLSGPAQGTLRLDYIPMGSVNWAAHGPADNEFVDDLTPFHSIIALLAAQYYQVGDAAANAVLDRQLQVRMKQLDQYLTQERQPDGAHYVEERMDDWFGF